MEKHGFNLPVDALSQEAFNCIERIADLNEAIENECKYGNLSNVVDFFIDSSRWNETAYIDKDKESGKWKIYVNDYFAQFVWATSLYLLVFFDNRIQITMMDKAGCNTHNHVADEGACDAALCAFEAARKLLYKDDMESVWSAVNCVAPGRLADIISHANAMYCYAMAFIYAHEFAHQYLGHVQQVSDTDTAIQQELDADNVAWSFLKDVAGEKDAFTCKAGIVAMFASILFKDKNSVDGGLAHPDVDVRMTNIVSTFTLDDRDNLWGLAALAMSMYMQAYHLLDDSEIKKLENEGFETYKDMYDCYMKKLEYVRGSKFPKECKKEWEKV